MHKLERRSLPDELHGWGNSRCSLECSSIHSVNAATSRPCTAPDAPARHDIFAHKSALVVRLKSSHSLTEQGAKGLAELSRACGRHGADIQQKVQKFDAIHSITITKGARTSEALVDERPVNKQALGTVFVGNLPQRWNKSSMVRDWLSSDVGLKNSDVVAVEFFGQYKQGQQIMVECKDGPAALELVRRVLTFAEGQRKSREPLVYEARKLNLTAAERQAASSSSKHMVCAVSLSPMLSQFWIQLDTLT